MPQRLLHTHHDKSGNIMVTRTCHSRSAYHHISDNGSSPAYMSDGHTAVTEEATRNMAYMRILGILGPSPTFNRGGYATLNIHLVHCRATV